jgi:hypothetical protein
VLDPAIIGTGVPVDPGKHTIEANVKGKVPFSTTLDVSERARTPSIEIPELEQADEPKPATSASTPAKKAEVQWNRDTGQTQRMLGLVAGGVGLVGIGLGAYFGLRTFSRWDEAQEHCTGGDCDATGVDLQARAKNAGLASTIGFAAGGALLATGVVLYLTAPSGAAKSGSTSPPNRDLRLGMGPGAVTLGGSF